MKKKDNAPQVCLVSSTCLEPWDWTNPWAKGIGGSEIAHCEMAIRLPHYTPHKVLSYAPVPWRGKRKGPNNTVWTHYREFIKDTFVQGAVPRIVVNYRDPNLFNLPKKHKEIRWFIAQDVDVGFNPQQLATIDRYVCLCETHCAYTLGRYPELKGRVYASTNGVRSDYLDKEYPFDNLHSTKVPYRMLFPSSPDRGLEFLLDNWFRIKERFPQAELRVAYGFNNMDKIISMSPGDPRIELRKRLIIKLNQPGVTVLGRLPTKELYDEWAKASVFPYSSDFPETSQCTIMEAMSLGAFPVTTKFWAQGEHGTRCEQAYVVDGLPQQSEVVRGAYLDMLYQALEASADNTNIDLCSKRVDMASWARETYNWNRVAEQWSKWIEKDVAKINA